MRPPRLCNRKRFCCRRRGLLAKRLTDTTLTSATINELAPATTATNGSELREMAANVVFVVLVRVKSRRAQAFIDGRRLTSRRCRRRCCLRTRGAFCVPHGFRGATSILSTSCCANNSSAAAAAAVDSSLPSAQSSRRRTIVQTTCRRATFRPAFIISRPAGDLLRSRSPQPPPPPKSRSLAADGNDIL